MLAWSDPYEAYRRTHLDARVQGGDTTELVRFCLEQAIQSLGSAIMADSRQEPTARSKSIVRALTAITALEMGVDRDAPMGTVLLHFYGATREALLSSVIQFDAERLASVRQDLVDVSGALHPVR
ncbi:flagellin [Altererythrobacter xixiisoli]|uniref:Flagellin n=1 Tax=Croceibacterium xixiisoli TaxID=1476466 RepID=A0A6I4TR87_9SPHN|nr:flagellar protein FliS [Croceibacterium xixiisoli]MXO98446.1 flagellin [Croceibacterium xixiisoli]